MEIQRPPIPEMATEANASDPRIFEKLTYVHFIIEIIISQPEAVIMRNGTSLSILKVRKA